MDNKIIKRTTELMLEKKAYEIKVIKVINRRDVKVGENRSITLTLTNEEKNIFRQGRNNKVVSLPKHAFTREYRAATGFECLVGFWYLGKEIKRFEKLMSQTEVQEYLESVLTSCKNSFTNAA